MPKSARFAEAFAKVGFKVSFSMYPDETAELCDLILPDLHSLESWGDAEAGRGMISMQQPAMEPVFSGTRATADVLIALAKKDPAAAEFRRFTQRDLHESDGVLKDVAHTLDRRFLVGKGL